MYDSECVRMCARWFNTVVCLSGAITLARVLTPLSMSLFNFAPCVLVVVRA